MLLLVRERASKALSMPVALSAGLDFDVDVEGSSSWERSRPRVFLTAVFVFLGAARAFFSSSARRASFSAFLRAASAFLASASSLWGGLEKGYGRLGGGVANFLAFDFAPLDHSWSSTTAFFAFSAAAFWFTASAFWVTCQRVVVPGRNRWCD